MYQFGPYEEQMSDTTTVLPRFKVRISVRRRFGGGSIGCGDKEEMC